MERVNEEEFFREYNRNGDKSRLFDTMADVLSETVLLIGYCSES